MMRKKKEPLTAEDKAEARAKRAEAIKHEKANARGGKMKPYKRINRTSYKLRKKKSKPDFEALAKLVDNTDSFLNAVNGQGKNKLKSLFSFQAPGATEELVYMMLNTQVPSTTTLILNKEEAKLLGLKLMRLSYGHKGE